MPVINESSHMSVNDSHLSAAGANVNNIEVNVRFGGQPPSEPAASSSPWPRIFGAWLLGLSPASPLPSIVAPSTRGLEASESVPGEATSPPRLQASLTEGPISIIPLEHAHMYERLALPTVPTREPSEIYVRQLYPHGHGYPCANPMPWGEPVQIGDIGVLESEGFDVLDNLYTLPDEFAHRNPVPAISVVHQPEYFVEGDTITGGVHRTVKMSNSAPAVIDEIVIHCPKEEGAVLAVTSPAERWRMKRVDILRDYLCQNASRLFEFLLERHSLPEGTSICVVTGTVLSSSWATATYSHPMDPSHNALVLKRVAGNESQSPYFLWTDQGSAQTRTHGRQVRATKDQCLFLKGFLLDASPSVWKARREAIKLQAACQERPDLQGDGGRGGRNSNNSQSGTSSTSQQGVETTNSLPSSLSSVPASRVLGGITVHSIPSDRGSASDYPSYRVNKSLLDLTKADFAITHDDDWREAVMNVANGPAVDRTYSYALEEQVRHLMSKNVATKNGVAFLVGDAANRIPTVTPTTVIQAAQTDTAVPPTTLVGQQYERIDPSVSQSSSEGLVYAPHQGGLYPYHLLGPFTFDAAGLKTPAAPSPDPLSAHDDAASEASVGGITTIAQTPSKERRSYYKVSEHFHSIDSFFSNSTTDAHYTYFSKGSDEESDEESEDTIFDKFDEEYGDDDDDDSECKIHMGSNDHENHGHLTPGNHNQQRFASSPYPRKRSSSVPAPSYSSPEFWEREGGISGPHRPTRGLEDSRSDSLGQSNYQDLQENRPPPVSQTSMLTSEDLQRRPIQHERERARAGQLVPGSTDNGTIPASGATVTGASPPAPIQPSVFDDFDSSWANNAGGIVDLDWDLSEMQDIVGDIQGPSRSSRGLRRGNASTISSGRRHSTASTSSGPFTRHLRQSGGQYYADERAKWVFVLDPNGGQDNRNGRERSSITSIWGGGGHPSITSSSMIGSSVGFQEAIAPFAATEPKWGREKDGTPWKGMAPETEEWWSSGTNGKYKVVRKNQNAEGKPPQQRLHIVHHRNNPYSPKYDKSDGPSITIHKHSKAVAFSISRHYRPKVPLDARGSSPSSAHTSRMAISSTDRRRPSPMILLASHKVQEAYTSTNTTRKLETHGLLNENSRHSSRDRERLARIKNEEDRLAEKERQRQPEKEQKKLEKSKGKGKGKDRGTQPSMSDLTAAESSSDTASSDKTTSYQRRGSEALLSDEDDDFRPRARARTPHTETYATLPPEVLESLAHNDNHVTSLFGWTKKSSTLFQRQLQTAYKPPWAMSQPRYRDRKGIVEDLNTSFQDVGHLPAVDEVRASQKRKQRHQEARNIAKSLNLPEPDNVLASLPSELFYMLLPLWPGETDASADAKIPFAMPHIPVEKRLYLLIYYRPTEIPPPPQGEKGKKANMKSSHSTSNSSRSSVRAANKSILFEKFHFAARIVTHDDIQGSSVRSPDAGLCVMGSLKEAYETMPQHQHIDTEFTMIGLSHSRDRGVELIPEGLEKLGLANRKLDHDAPPKSEYDSSMYPMDSEEEEEPETIYVLTPIGRAVVEMAWLGAMALTSFG